MYDLKKDPLEENPLRVTDEYCLQLFHHIIDRWEELKKENDI